jgi:hypothetical protein
MEDAMQVASSVGENGHARRAWAPMCGQAAELEKEISALGVARVSAYAARG